MAADHRVGVGLGGDQRVANRYHKPAYGSNLALNAPDADNLGSVATVPDRPAQKWGGIS
jgi:hypothetical protein